MLLKATEFHGERGVVVVRKGANWLLLHRSRNSLWNGLFKREYVLSVEGVSVPAISEHPKFSQDDSILDPLPADVTICLSYFLYNSMEPPHTPVSRESSGPHTTFESPIVLAYQSKWGKSK